ncbi:DUF6233 domain-containing protein [Streptomyces sp. NPDC058545]|uniref:DUF6233 domain-containing protein n=1 Tax=Streptomyces sp. NPDC058545 TaxID=3346544 RepID=UPI00364BAEAC
MRKAAPDKAGAAFATRTAEVHIGGCYVAGKRQRVITREQALAALADGIRACIHCRPDAELGVLG